MNFLSGVSLEMDSSGTTDLAIETHGLTKRFGTRLAVNDVELRVPRGSVFGFLGPNGSGKTTTIRMLLGLASATSGEVSLLGRSMPSMLGTVLPLVGALVEGPGFYPYLSGVANLRRLDSANRSAPGATRTIRVERALARVGLAHAADKKVRAYSLGMKQRLGIANALLTPRQLLVLDEPTNGLDPQGTREVRNLVRSLAAEGTTVFVSSHLLAEIEQMCSHVAIMSAGRLVAQGTLDELRGVGEPTIVLETPDIESALPILALCGIHPDGRKLPASGAGISRLVAAITKPGVEADVVVAALVNGGVRVHGFTLQHATLEDRFVQLTGEGFEVAE